MLGLRQQGGGHPEFNEGSPRPEGTAVSGEDLRAYRERLQVRHRPRPVARRALDVAGQPINPAVPRGPLCGTQRFPFAVRPPSRCGFAPLLAFADQPTHVLVIGWYANQAGVVLEALHVMEMPRDLLYVTMRTLTLTGE